jgi:excinuclease UvrABC nuclease subunit
MLRIVLTRKFTKLKKEYLTNEQVSTCETNPLKQQNIYSNDLKNWNVKQGVSVLGVHLVREHANAPKFCGANSPDHSSIPSLMIIDGGKGHLSVVQKIMTEFDLKIPFVCISKGSDRNAGCEQFHMPGKEAFTIDKNLPVMKYLQILRDEAHNFAIKNHRLRRKAIKVSSLDDIDSIGLIRKKALLHYFGSYKAVCNATIDELSKVNGISQTLAKNIFTSLHNK